MLTPQEVSEHAFSKASFGGYNMAMVDEFLDLVTADYTSLYNENAVLKSKMKVLADKVEEYRSTEEAMRKALLTAQRLADEMVKEAENKKASLLKEAEADARERMDQLRREIEDEQFRLETARKDTADYVEKVRALHQQGLAMLDGLGELTAAPAQKPESALSADPVSVAAMEIEDTIQKLMAEEMPQGEDRTHGQDDFFFNDSAPRATERPEQSASAEPASEEDGDEDEDSEPTRRINFDNLQFGRDFEIR